MWCRSICSRLTVLGSALLAACSLASSAAHAQQRDDAWVISQVMAGKFEELRSLEKLSDEGVPFAMYWWGQPDAWSASSIAATSRRRWSSFCARPGRVTAAPRRSSSPLPPNMPGEFTAKLTAGVAVPKDGYARQVHAIQSVAGLSQRVDPKARADFVALATSERQVGLLAELVELEGLSKRADELRAVADSGHVGVSELVAQWEIISARPTRRSSSAHAPASCGWRPHIAIRDGIETGEQILPPDTLSVCERAAAQGFPGAVRALLRHHHHSKNQRAAEYFAGVCDALLGLGCAEDIAAYYDDRRDESADLRAKWELWILPKCPGAGKADLRDKDEGLRRRLFTLVVRTALINEACMMQRLDVKTGAREANPQCPWRIPIAIPAEFLSGAR